MAQKTIQDAIESTAKGPASATAGASSATAQRIPDQILADRYLAGQVAGAAEKTGLRFFKVKGNAFES